MAVRNEPYKICLDGMRIVRIPEKYSQQINENEIFGYIFTKIEGYNHVIAILVSPDAAAKYSIKPRKNYYIRKNARKARKGIVKEVVGEKVQPYYSKPTEEQVRFADTVRNQDVSHEIKSGYKGVFGREYDDILESYNKNIANGMSVEDAHAAAIGKSKSNTDKLAA